MRKRQFLRFAAAAAALATLYLLAGGCGSGGGDAAPGPVYRFSGLTAGGTEGADYRDRAMKGEIYGVSGNVSIGGTIVDYAWETDDLRITAPDGGATLRFEGQDPVRAELVLDGNDYSGVMSESGNIGLFRHVDPAGEGGMLVLVKQGAGMTDAILHGAYWHVGLQAAETGGGENFFPRKVSSFGRLAFDGGGRFEGWIFSNSYMGGMDNNTAVVGSYSVDGSGEYSEEISGGNHVGGVSTDGAMVAAAGVSDAAPRGAVYMIRAGEGAYDNASLDGTYHFVGTNAVMGEGCLTWWGEIAFDGGGNYAWTYTIGLPAGPFEVSGSGTYDVSPDGSFAVDWTGAGYSLYGGIGTGAHQIVLADIKDPNRYSQAVLVGTRIAANE